MSDNINVEQALVRFELGGTFYQFDVDPRYCDDKIYFSTGGHASKLDPAKLAAWAKAGCPDWNRGGPIHPLITEALSDAGYPSIDMRPSDCVNALAAERDRLKARVAELEKGAKQPKPQKVRCVDCEHLELDTVQDGRGKCALDSKDPGSDIYRVSRCGRDFTPAAEGCGSVDQVLRAELARKTR